MHKKTKYVYISKIQLIYPLKCGKCLGITLINQNYKHKEKQIITRECLVPFSSEFFALPSLTIKILFYASYDMGMKFGLMPFAAVVKPFQG
jgi:hypothetical protein